MGSHVGNFYCDFCMSGLPTMLKDLLPHIFLKILFIYSWETKRERQRYRQREKQAPRREPYMGLHPGSPGSQPGWKVVLNRWATQANAPHINIEKALSVLQWPRATREVSHISHNWYLDSFLRIFGRVSSAHFGPNREGRHGKKNHFEGTVFARNCPLCMYTSSYWNFMNAPGEVTCQLLPRVYLAHDFELEPQLYAYQLYTWTFYFLRTIMGVTDFFVGPETLYTGFQDFL